jgi:hypothetical protein
MVSTYKTDTQGRHLCPNCDKHYEPDFDSKEDAKENGEDYQAEQYISGLCSNKCWNEYLGIST